jgi:hypothetical protein
MAIHYPSRDGYPSMFEDDAGSELASATMPISELIFAAEGRESRNLNSADLSLPHVFAYPPQASSPRFQISP